MNLIEPKCGPDCEECPLFRAGIEVNDVMPLDYCGLSFVGEMPGSAEVKNRMCFIGPSGKLLWAACDEVGIDRNSVHVTNCMRCGLPRGAKLSEGKAKTAMDCCRPLIEHNLRELGAKVVCAVGAVPLTSLTGLKGIFKYRGTYLPPEDDRPWYLTSTFHPAGLLRVEAARILIEPLMTDLRKAYDMARGKAELWEPTVADARDEEALLAWLDDALEHPERPIALDVETDGIDALECNLLTVGLASGLEGEEPTAWSIPWHTGFPMFYKPDVAQMIEDRVCDLLDSPQHTIIFHNMSFDVPVLRHHLGIEILADIHDTLLLDHASFPKVPHGLQQVASRFYVLEAWKEEYKVVETQIDHLLDKLDKEVEDWEGDEASWVQAEKLDMEMLAELLWYNAADTAVTWKLWWDLMREAREHDTMDVYEADRKLLLIALDWHRDGVAVDLELRDELDVKYVEDIKRLRGRLRRLSLLPTATSVKQEIDGWERRLGLLMVERAAARKMCVICGSWKASGPALQRHVDAEHPGHPLQHENADWLVLVLEQEKAIREQLKYLRKKKPHQGNLNPNSDDQIRMVLDLRGVVPSKTTKKTLKPSTAKDALWDSRDDEFIDCLFEYRKIHKLWSTYIKNLEYKLGSDGRLHPVWKLHSTPSGRFGTQPAVQNWPSDMKKMMIASRRSVIVGADFAALELRISAWLAGQEDLIEAFLNDADIHAKHAGYFFPTIWPQILKRWEDSGGDNKLVPEYKELRGKGKPVTFGKIYRAGPQTLYEQIREERPDVKTPAERKRLLAEVTAMSRILDQKYPNIVRSAEVFCELAEDTLQLRECVGRRMRKWPMGDVPLTEAANHPIQGAAAAIMNAATLRLVDRLKKDGYYRNGVWVILQIHDALYLEVEEELADYAKQVLEECMLTELTTRSLVDNKDHFMRFPAEATVANNVADAA